MNALSSPGASSSVLVSMCHRDGPAAWSIGLATHPDRQLVATASGGAVYIPEAAFSSVVCPLRAFAPLVGYETILCVCGGGAVSLYRMYSRLVVATEVLAPLSTPDRLLHVLDKNYVVSDVLMPLYTAGKILSYVHLVGTCPVSPSLSSLSPSSLSPCSLLVIPCCGNFFPCDRPPL